MARFSICLTITFKAKTNLKTIIFPVSPYAEEDRGNRRAIPRNGSRKRIVTKTAGNNTK
jgi:hypothetical protein